MLRHDAPRNIAMLIPSFVSFCQRTKKL